MTLLSFRNRNKISSCFLSLLLLCLFFPELKAQKSKIGIVFNADTTLVCQHVGYTIFSNSTNNLPLDINIRKYVIEKLDSDLSDKYEVHNITLPDSLQNVKLGFFESGISKKLKVWANTQKDDYEQIVFISNSDIPTEYSVLIPKNTSGIYSQRGGPSWYTTISLNVYDTVEEKLVYQGSAASGDWFPKLYNIKLPKNKKSFDADLLEACTEQFKDFLNDRINYFMAKSDLLPNSYLENKTSLDSQNKKVSRSKSSLNPKHTSSDPKDKYKDNIY